MNHIYQIIIGIFLTLPLLACGGEVQTIGHYSKFSQDVISDEPHPEGYAIHLYKQGDVFFGELAVGDGSIEIKSGLLENVKIDEATKSLTFEAKLSTGTFQDDQSDAWHRTRDLYIFSGKINKYFIVGTIEHRDGYKKDVPGSIQRIKLPHVKKKTWVYSVPSSMSEWLKNQSPQDW